MAGVLFGLCLFCLGYLGFDFLLFFSDEFPEEGFWVDLPGFCLCKDVAYFFYGELFGLSEYFFEVGVVEEGVAYCLDEVCAF